MLTQLVEQPVDGSTVDLVLRFSDGSEVAVQAPVRSVLDE
jgi:copper(I)-binding protein